MQFKDEYLRIYRHEICRLSCRGRNDNTSWRLSILLTFLHDKLPENVKNIALRNSKYFLDFLLMKQQKIQHANRLNRRRLPHTIAAITPATFSLRGEKK